MFVLDIETQVCVEEPWWVVLHHVVCKIAQNYRYAGIQSGIYLKNMQNLKCMIDVT